MPAPNLRKLSDELSLYAQLKREYGASGVEGVLRDTARAMKRDLRRLRALRADPRREREVEQALTDHIQRFLLELGAGFAFMGRQVHLEIESQDFYLDVLFYHVKLRCFVVVELKAVPFDPAFVGTLNLYLSATDDLLKQPDDKPTIGLLLCRNKDKTVVEYALRGVSKPIGVAEWETQLTQSLPAELAASLPSVAELEAELQAEWPEDRA